MGGGNPPSVNESTERMLQALATYAPDAIRAIGATVPGTAQLEQDVAEQISPQQAALQTELYRTYGPELNRIGSNIDRQNQLAASNTEAEIAAGPGKQLVASADALQRSVDPEFYQQRGALNDAISSYLGAYDPTKLTPTEEAQIARGLAATDSQAPPSAMKTIRNAAAFGDAATKKWQNFGDAVSRVSSALPSLRSGLPAFEVATRRALTPNTGEARLSQPYNPSTAFATNFGFANNALNEIGANQRTSINKQDSTMDKILKGTQAFSNIGQGIGGFASI